MKLENGQLVYNAEKGIILLLASLENKYKNHIVVHSDRWI